MMKSIDRWTCFLTTCCNIHPVSYFLLIIISRRLLLFLQAKLKNLKIIHKTNTEAYILREIEEIIILFRENKRKKERGRKRNRKSLISFLRVDYPWNISNNSGMSCKRISWPKSWIGSRYLLLRQSWPKRSKTLFWTRSNGSFN